MPVGPKNGDPNYDYGAITIPTDLGEQTGTLGFGVLSKSDLLAATGNLAGYPGDKPAGTLWYDYHRIASVTTRKVYYGIDTAGGKAGRPCTASRVMIEDGPVPFPDSATSGQLLS